MATSDGKLVNCLICNGDDPEAGAVWIQKASLPSHLKGKSHLACAEERKIQQARREEINRRAQAEDIQELRVAEISRAAPLNAVELTAKSTPQPSRIVSAAERRMWDEYEEDREAVRIDAGVDPKTAAEQVRSRWQHQADNFGVWNEQAAAQQLGFGSAGTAGEEEILGENEDAIDTDAYVADLLKSSGAFK